MEFIGLARTETEILDLSVLTASGIKGIAGVLGITEFGEPNQAKLIGSWTEYQRNFGGLIDGSDFPLLCKIALENGARLRVSPVAHYTDITDHTTLQGTKATGTITATTDSAVFTSIWPTAAGNKVTVTTVAAANGVENEVDIRVSVAGFTGEIDLTQNLFNVKQVLTADEKATLNTQLKLVKIGTITGKIPVGTVTLSGGARVLADIDDVDFIGDSASSTGVYSFDNWADITYIAVPEKAVPDIDIALANYADLRTGIVAVLRTPVGIDGHTAADYRSGTGIYSHNPVDTFRAIMTFGGLKIKHPRTLAEIEITELPNVLALLTKKDTTNKEWFTFAGPKRGKIKSAVNVVYNLASAARRLEAARVDSVGLTPVINHKDFGIVAWGNGTMHRGNTLLKHANVAFLIVLLERLMPSLTMVEAFDPNDVETWKAIYRRIKPVLDRMQEERAFWNYLYQGDQDIDHISQALVNDPARVDEGGYTFRLWVSPKVGMKYIGVQIAVANSNTDFALLGEQEL